MRSWRKVNVYSYAKEKQKNESIEWSEFLNWENKPSFLLLKRDLLQCHRHTDDIVWRMSTNNFDTASLI